MGGCCQFFSGNLSLGKGHEKLPVPYMHQNGANMIVKSRLTLFMSINNLYVNNFEEIERPFAEKLMKLGICGHMHDVACDRHT